ncbi:hypothetical protein PpBr36_03021 [Pyricularia pennisetigena]|uniref:hypothetical protein n=1 Tax=Pyricularia pennisetigena TaxID=1578925 RepID=UPI0011547E3D|nr:hypothetical protein PpBr36_03021 [Pyricularia pennisetigena]TLS31117.1 hypothetical protein PpBr36_03021 [Pyricularia pennisetigena]
MAPESYWRRRLYDGPQAHGNANDAHGPTNAGLTEALAQEGQAHNPAQTAAIQGSMLVPTAR